MKKTEFAQIKTLNIKELSDKAKALKKEIAELGFDKNMKKLKDLKSISKKRKERAQILTVIGQKELLARLESGIQEEDSNKAVIASPAKQSSQDKKLTKIATSSATKIGTPRNDKKKGSKK